MHIKKKKILFIYPVKKNFYINLAAISAFSLCKNIRNIDYEILFLLSQKKDIKGLKNILNLLNFKSSIIFLEFKLNPRFPSISYKTFALYKFFNSSKHKTFFENFEYVSVVDADTIFKNNIDFLEKFLEPNFVLAQIVTPLKSSDYIDSQKINNEDIGLYTVMKAFKKNIINFENFPAYRVNAGFYIISSNKIQSIINTWHEYLQNSSPKEIKLSEALFSFAIIKNNLGVKVFSKDIIYKNLVNNHKFIEIFKDYDFEYAENRLIEISSLNKKGHKILFPKLINSEMYLRKVLLHYMSGQKYLLVKDILKLRLLNNKIKFLVIISFITFKFQYYVNACLKKIKFKK